LPAIEGEQRDNTEDWVVPRGAVPLMGELEARVDEALVIARASEAGVREVGEMALDAARQARRAAEAAEASARAAEERTSGRGGGGGGADPADGECPADLPRLPDDAVPGTAAAGAQAGAELVVPHFEVRFRRFNERADRVSARLRALGGHPGEPVTASFAPVRRRGDD
jgi:non-ribosomal peptide synthetase component F